MTARSRTDLRIVESYWNKTYDIRGRLVTDADPDKGTTTYTYDSLGQQVTSTDARGVTLWTKYDKLGRKTELRDDNATGVLRSSWTYDTVRAGALSSSTRFADGQSYTSEVTAYDSAGRPTSSRVVVPASEGLLAGNYVTGVEYNVDGTVKSTTLPAVDDPVAEELSYTYDALGNVKKLDGLTPLVTGTIHSSLGHMSQRTLGTTVGKNVYDTRQHDLATNQVTRRQVGLQGSATAPKVDLRYTYDNAGNVTKLNDVFAGDTAQTSASTWRQCFKYDYLRRMTLAHTSSGNTCAAPTSSNLGSLTPYRDTYTFAKSGNRTKVVSVRKPASSLVTTTHTSTFPAATAVRPHAVTKTVKTGGSTGTESYTYDAAGSLSKRSTTTSAGKNIVFDREGHQKTVTDIATGKVTEYLYDADGNRLIERDAGDVSTTLFLASGEVKLKAGARTTIRTYTIGDEAVATRTAAGVTLMANDHHGTPLISVNATTQAFVKRRYSPYGEVLQAPASWPSTRGYLNKVTDKTGTTHLGAREYDPAGSRFISVDPVMDPMDPQSMNAYAYAHNRPVTSSDPSGLYIPCEGKCGGNPGSPYTKDGNNGSSGPVVGKGGGAAQVEAAKKRAIIAKFTQSHDAWVKDFTGGLDCPVGGSMSSECRAASAYSRWLWDVTKIGRDDRTELQQAALNEWFSLDRVEEDWVTDAIISTVATLGVAGIYSGLRGAATGTFGAANERGAIGLGGSRLTNSQAADMASRVGYAKTNYMVRGQTVFSSGKTFIVQDTTAHSGGLWKMGKSVDSLKRKGTRLGTYDYDMNYIGP